MGTTTREMNGRDLERLIPSVGGITEKGGGDSKSSSPSASPLTSSSHHSGEEAFSKVIRSWATEKFMTGCVILLPMAVTFYKTRWFFHFVDGFFSIRMLVSIHLNSPRRMSVVDKKMLNCKIKPILFWSWICDPHQFHLLGWCVHVLMVGNLFSQFGRMVHKENAPCELHLFSSKQISAAISPDQNSKVFKEVAIIRHPRIGENAFGFITSTVILRKSSGDEELCCVYVPTNHLYLGDIFLVNSKDIMRPNLSVREGIEIVLSGGMSIPQIMSITDVQPILSPRIGNYAIPHV